MPDTPTLKRAYALETPEDNRSLYAGWAPDYDTQFAQTMDYRLPQIVASILAEQMADGPVLDVGAGTGLLAQAFPSRADVEMHALDISPDMLEVAMAKGLYTRSIVADLTQVLPIAPETYGAIVSSGTFTHGHVGPKALDALLQIAKPGALFVLAINAEHFTARGFAAKFAQLEPKVAELELREANIYGPDADAEHRADTAQIAIFFKR